MGGLLRHLQREPIGSLPWVTSDRVEPAAGPAMSASHPKRPSAMKMRSVATGHKPTSRSRKFSTCFHLDRATKASRAPEMSAIRIPSRVSSSNC